MTRTIISIALAVLVILSTAAYAEESKQPPKKDHVSTGTITFTHTYDKASPTLN